MSDIFKRFQFKARSIKLEYLKIYSTDCHFHFHKESFNLIVSKTNLGFQFQFQIRIKSKVDTNKASNNKNKRSLVIDWNNVDTGWKGSGLNEFY